MQKKNRKPHSQNENTKPIAKNFYKKKPNPAPKKNLRKKQQHSCKNKRNPLQEKKTPAKKKTQKYIATKHEAPGKNKHTIC